VKKKALIILAGCLAAFLAVAVGWYLWRETGMAPLEQELEAEAPLQAAAPENMDLKTMEKPNPATETPEGGIADNGDTEGEPADSLETESETEGETGQTIIFDNGETVGESNQDEQNIDETTYYGRLVAGLKALTPGKDYVEREVVGSAASKREAKEIADSLGLTLQSYSDGVAVYTTSATVLELMSALAKAGEESIKISPNYLYRLSSP
jgi:hypothetical protein